MGAAGTALIVVDDDQMIAIIEFALETQGIAAMVARDGPTALQVIGTSWIDLAIVDVTIPVVDGGPLLRQIADAAVPVIALTARSNMPEAGSDAADRLIAPFHPRDLASRARELLHRGIGHRAVLNVGELRIDLIRHAVTVYGERLDLPFTEFKLLAHLATHRGTPQSWTSLLHDVWGIQAQAGDRDIVKSTVYRLRGRLARAGADPDCIVTLRGAGYLVLDLPPLNAPDATPPRRPHR